MAAGSRSGVYWDILSGHRYIINNNGEEYSNMGYHNQPEMDYRSSHKPLCFCTLSLKFYCLCFSMK